MKKRFRTELFFVLPFALLTGTAFSQTLALPYRSVAAEYSSALDRIIMISGSPNQLHIYNPATRADVAINLSKPPLSLSVSPDGMHAAVGHDALISYVNLSTNLLEKTLPAPTTVTSLALGVDYVYIPSVGSIRVSTGVLNSAVTFPGVTVERLHPGGSGLYAIPPGSPGLLMDIDVSGGPMGGSSTGPYSGDYPVCGGIWFSPDGRRIYTGCGTVFQANPSVPGPGEFSWSRVDSRWDGLYWTSLAGAPQIRSLSEGTSGKVALISIPSAAPAIADNQVFLYDSFFEPAGVFQLPGFTAGGNTFQSHAQQVFFNSASTAIYVVMQADSSSGLANDFAIQVIPLANPAACSPALGAATASAAASGGLGSVSIVAPGSCIYQGSSDSSWLQIVSGGYGSGNGTLTYIVRPNSSASRTGTLTVGNQTLTVTQQGVAPTSLLTPLSFSVAGADYSKTLDKLILIPSNLNELHLYDTFSGSDQVVALPKAPLCVSVSRDGLSAAVGMDGWISIVNLGSASLTSTIQVFTDVHSILNAGNGFLYALPQRTRSNLFSVEVVTGIITAANATNLGRIPRLSASGTYFYLEGSKWDTTQGAAKLASPQTNFSNLSVCNNFWLSEDGARMFTGCGTSYTTSDTASSDLQPNGSFANAPAVQWASESSKLHTTAVIPGVGAGVATADTFVQVYGDAALGYSGSLALPSFNVGSVPFAGHGRYVFWNKTTDRLVVVQQADSTARLTSDYGVTTYALNTPAAGCTFGLGSSSASFSTSGGSSTVSVSTGASCIWKASSNAPWITVTAGAVAFASNMLAYTVSPNATNVARVGTMTIAGQTFTVMESGAAPGLTVTKTHSGNFTAGQAGATYSIMVSSVSGAPTSGTLTVTDVLPAGLTANAIAGAGWNCTLATFSCSRTDIIAPGSSYPPLQVTVNVANNAPASVTNTATVSGGGLPTPISATDVTAIDGGTTIVSGSLAQGKAATQSSTLAGYAGAGAASAVDGNTSGVFFGGSVTATNLDANAWWQVDLGASATIDTIAIWNRTDCCGTRLSDYWVFVSDTPFGPADTAATLQSRAGTWSNHQTTAPNPSTTIAAGGAQGRYVRVQLAGANYLSLAEVQVFGVFAQAAQNLAQGKSASQSSTLPGYPSAVASAAVDGNTNGSFFAGSITATNLDSNAWWQVDLGASASISSIVIWNRVDCCSTRLSDYWVFVSDSPFLPTDTPATLQSRAGTFSSHQTTAPNPSTTISTAVQGRYVRVQLTGANYLSLAEVQVFGTGASGSNLALSKTATQSSTLPGYPTAAAGAAVDGRTDGNFFNGSVTATNLDPYAWWQVDLGASYSINSIVLWNRTDCCGPRLSDYWAFVSDTPFLPTDTPATLQSRAGTWNIHVASTVPPESFSIPTGGTQGRYVRVQLAGTNYLSLAEVQVLGGRALNPQGLTQQFR
jgi:hypothetical protein